MTDSRARQLQADAQAMKLSRRSILRRASALGLSTVTAAGIVHSAGKSVSAQRTPYFLQGGSALNILASTAFVPAAQDYFAEQAAAFGAENGVDVTVDFVNWPDLQPRITSAVQAGAGPDIIELWDAIPYLFAENLVEVNDLATSLGEIQGGYFDWTTKTASVDGVWHSVPHGTSSIAIAYRKSMLEEVGVTDPENNFPKTWEELYEVGKKLKEMGKPIGQSLGQSPSDPITFVYSLMWSYGAKEVEEDGKTVAFDTESFRDGLGKFVQGWADAFDESGLGWDDSTNNAAYLSGEVSMTLNGSSIYLAASDPEGENSNPELAEDTFHAPLPAGPDGQHALLGSRSYGILDYSPNQDVARSFLEWWFQEEQYVSWLEVYEGYIVPPGPAFIENRVFTEDPKLAEFVKIVEIGRNKGFAGPSNQKAAQAAAQYVVLNAVAGAVQSGDANASIEEGASMLQRIYGR